MEVKPTRKEHNDIDLMLRLAYAAYAGNYNIAGIGAARAIRKLVRRVAPAQSVVWGPEDAGHVLDLFSVAMAYVSRDTPAPGAPPVYTLAIRGTNPVSWTTVLVQDLDVRDTVPWRLISPHAKSKPSLDPYILGGAAEALDLLTALKSRGKTLLEFFLDKVSNEDARIRVTGHSLGGMVTTIFSVWLQNEFAARGVSLQGRLQAYPVASLTPGNADFARYTESLFEANGNRHLRIVTALDFAPKAWIQQELGTVVPTMYAPTVTLTDLDQHLIKFFYNISLNRDYAHTGDYVKLKSSIEPSLPHWLMQFLHQHMIGYLYSLQDIRARDTLLRMLHLEILKGCPRTELRLGLNNGKVALQSLQQLGTLLRHGPLMPHLPAVLRRSSGL